MPMVVIVTCYFAAALALISAGVIGASILRSPVEAAAAGGERPKLVRKADASTPEQPATDGQRSSGTGFRYGPEINHGRSDAPVSYRQQALKEAKSAPVKPRKKPYQERRIEDPGVAMSYAPAVRPSGH